MKLRFAFMKATVLLLESLRNGGQLWAGDEVRFRAADMGLARA